MCLTFRSLVFFLRLFALVLVTECGSNPEILSVTRSSNEGDSFDLGPSSSSSACTYSCKQYGATLKLGAAIGGTNSCSCQCSDSKPTFYITKSGHRSCVSDGDVLVDSNDDHCDFYIDNSQKLKVLDLRSAGKEQLKPQGICEQLWIREWQFLYNASWISTSTTLFSAITVKSGGSSAKPLSFLTWNASRNSFHNGLLMKLTAGCMSAGETDDRCVVFKTKGTHYYVGSPTPSLSPVFPKSLPVDVVPTATSKKLPDALPGSTESDLPTEGSSKAVDRSVWIAVALGLSGLLCVVIIGIVGFLLLRRQRKGRAQHSRTGRRFHQVQSSSSAGSPLHDYEYIHYPCLSEGPGSPPATPIGNPMCVRGQDNKLIIWSHGHNPTKRLSHSQSTEALAPRLPYQRLLARTSSSSPDCSVVIISPVSPGSEGVFPYQRLVRTETLPGSEPEVSGGTVQDRGCDMATVEAEPCSEAYQTLATPEFQQSYDGCTNMQVESRPESLEYDYAKVPVALNCLEMKTILGSPSNDTDDTPRKSSVDTSVADLSFTAVSPNQVSAIPHVAVEKKSKPTSDITSVDGPLASAGTDSDVSTPMTLSAQNEELLVTSASCCADSGKRGSVSSVESENYSPGFAEIEEDDHEYMVLEGLEATEGN